MSRAQILTMERKSLASRLNVLENSLRSHLASKGKLCTCCELPEALCRCLKRKPSENVVR